MGTEAVLAEKFVGREASLFGGEVAERATLMRRSPLFAGLSMAEYTRIAERARTRTYARNELLFMQGQPFEKLTILDSGCVKLTHLNSKGNEVILALRCPCDALDLPVGRSGGNHAFTAQAMVRVKALSWSMTIMDNLMATIPQLSVNVCQILSRQLSELQERYYELSGEKVERRLAGALIRLADQVGIPTSGGSEVSISRQELAQMVGTTLFTVSRLISRWGELGLVVPRREAVVVLKSRRLDLLSAVEP